MKNITRVRYAPSPTGDPHIGNVRTALYCFLFAKHTGGQFILRIEDTDKAREVQGSTERIQESLNWLGISWDEGPILQSSRLPLYQKIAKELVEKEHAYYCFCTPERLVQVRQDQAKASLPPMYDKQCRTISLSQARSRAEIEPHVIRLKVPEEGRTSFTDYLRGEISFPNVTIDDQVLLKSDGFPTYHLAVVVDDHDMHISHVLRGDDWISSAPKHVLLYQYLGWELPVFVHLSVIVGTDKKKLSKRLGDISLLAYKDKGYTPQAVVNFMVRLGFSPQDDRKLYTLEELAQEFRLERLQSNPAIFDGDKLNWFNRMVKEHMGESDELIKQVITVLQSHHIVTEPFNDIADIFVKEAAKRVDTVSEVEEKLSYLWQEPKSDALVTLQSEIGAEMVKNILHAAEVTLTPLTSWDETSIGNAMRETARHVEGASTKHYYQAVTAAVTGSVSSPPLFASLVLLGKDTVLKRLRIEN